MTHDTSLCLAWNRERERGNKGGGERGEREEGRGRRGGRGERGGGERGRRGERGEGGGGLDQVLRAFFSQCSATGRKWWVWSSGPSPNELSASTYMSGTYCT